MGYIESTIGAGITQGIQNAYDRYEQRKAYREDKRRLAEEHQLKMDLARPTQQRAQLESELLNQEIAQMYKHQTMQMEAEGMRRAIEDFMANPYSGGADTIKRLKSGHMGNQLFGSFRNLEPAVLNYTPEAITNLAKEQGIDINEIMEAPYKWSIITEDTADGSGNVTKYLANIEDVYALMGGNPSRFSIFQNQGEQNYGKFTAEHPEIMQPFSQYAQALTMQNKHTMVDQGNQQNGQPTIDFNSTQFGRDFKQNILSKPGIETANAQADLLAKQIGLQNAMYEQQALADYKNMYGDEAFTNLILKQKRGTNATIDTINYLANIKLQSGEAKNMQDALNMGINMVLGTQQMKNQAYFSDNMHGNAADITKDTLVNELKLDQYELENTLNNLKNEDGYINLSAIRPITPHEFSSSSTYDKKLQEKRYNTAKLNIANLFGGDTDMAIDVIRTGKTIDAVGNDKLENYIQDLIKYSGEDKEVRDFSKEMAQELQYITAADKIISTSPKTRSETQGIIDSIYNDLISYTPALNPESSEYAGAVKLVGLQAVKSFVTGTASNRDMAKVDQAIGTLAKNEADVLSKLTTFLKTTRDTLERNKDRFRDKVVRAYIVDRKITGIDQMLDSINKQLYGNNLSKQQSKVIATGNAPTTDNTSVGNTTAQSNTNVVDLDKNPNLANTLKPGDRVIYKGREAVVE
ncbi:hypothetical protein [Campylobacter jejuni]|uniref:hypothetical protein n=1 Tax=Campylobacter jejuni TaxID=197 RepID=UPI000F81463C|nr:hypothetical protein [Campylobacter jejuni]RTH72575.1 hypothetical protein C3I43_08675 [Campylobacter jejuni]